MKLRAKQNTCITTPLGVVYLRGPQFDDEGKQLNDGQVVDVDETFELNPDVFEEVVLVRPGNAEHGIPDVYEVVERDRAPKPVPKKKQPAGGAATP